MKIPLRYQVSEYDCGPTSLLNARIATAAAARRGNAAPPAWP